MSRHQPDHIKQTEKLLLAADESQSMFKALELKTRHVRIKQIAIKKVLDFMRDNLDNASPEISRLITANLCYLHTKLMNFTMYFTKDRRLNSSMNLEHRQNIEWSWTTLDIHKLMMQIIDKWTDNEWMSKNDGLHSICVYYAVTILWDLCKGKNKVVVNKIVTETDIIKIILRILSTDNRNITFIERLAGLHLLHDILWSDQIDYNESFCKTDADDNVIQILMRTCCNAFNIVPLGLDEYSDKLSVYQRMALDEYGVQLDSALNKQEQHIFEKNEMSENLMFHRMNYTRGHISDKNRYTQTLHLMAYHTRMRSIAILQALFVKIKNTALMAELCSDVSAMYLKRYLQTTLMFMRYAIFFYVHLCVHICIYRQGNQSNQRPHPTTLDVVSVLVQKRSIAEQLVSDPEILNMLIIGMKSRSFLCEFQNREIIFIWYYIVCHHELLPKKYYFDLILVLNDMKEIRWEDTSIFSQDFPSLSLSTMIHRTLYKLFRLPSFERSNMDKYECSICQNEFDCPHRLKCGHHVCYGCLVILIRSNTNWEDFVSIQQPKSNKCPLCRADVSSRIDDFTLNEAFVQEMHSEIVCVDDLKFRGTESDFWEYMKTKYVKNIKMQIGDKQNENSVDRIDELLSIFDEKSPNLPHFDITSEFIDFCNFMKTKSMYYANKMETSKQIKIANEIKLIGNKHFKNKNYKEAISTYQEALNACPYLEQIFRSKCYSNISLCYQKMSDHLNSYRAAQRGISLHRTAFQQSQPSAKLYAKLQRHMTFAYGKLADMKLLSRCHAVINVGPSNLLCPNRRLYDVLLYQSCWEFLATQSQVLVYETGMRLGAAGAVKSMQEIRETDPTLIANNKLEGSIKNYPQLNFDVHQ